MSSYLTFYIVPKEEGSKPIALLNYSRNNDIYQYFVDNVRVTFIGMEENPQYTELTEEKIDWVIHDLKSDISKAQKRVEEYEHHVDGNMDIIEEIISQKDYIDDLKYALSETEFIKQFVTEATHSWSDYNKVLCNVD
jgi:hypothetical protein